MAAKRRGPQSEPGARAFTVVVEKMYAEFQVFGEALAGLRAQVDEGFAEVQEGFAQVNLQFEQVDRRFEQVDRRFEQVDWRFNRIEQDTELVKVAVLEHGRELKALRVAVTDLATRKVDRDEVEGIVARVLARTHP